MARVVLDRVHCIGCADCPKVCPGYFGMRKDGKAILNDVPLGQEQSCEFPEKDRPCVERAAKVCPVDVIWVED